MTDSNVGRPALTDEQLDKMFRKLEPYLKAGLNVYKACLEAGVPKSTVYDYIRINEAFSEKIKTAQQHLSVLLATTVVRQLHDIVKKQTTTKKIKVGDKTIEKRQVLNGNELGFLKWFATNSNVTKEEFGERKDISFVDPEAELRRITAIIEEATTKEIDPIPTK